MYVQLRQLTLSGVIPTTSILFLLIWKNVSLLRQPKIFDVSTRYLAIAIWAILFLPAVDATNSYIHKRFIFLNESSFVCDAWRRPGMNAENILQRITDSRDLPLSSGIYSILFIDSYWESVSAHDQRDIFQLIDTDVRVWIYKQIHWPRGRVRRTEFANSVCMPLRLSLLVASASIPRCAITLCCNCIDRVLVWASLNESWYRNK